MIHLGWGVRYGVRVEVQEMELGIWLSLSTGVGLGVASVPAWLPGQASPV